MTAGLAQAGAALAAATVLTVVGARDLSRLPATITTLNRRCGTSRAGGPVAGRATRRI